MEPLKPCPLCGGACEQHIFESWVKCTTKGCPYVSVPITVHNALPRRSDNTMTEDELMDVSTVLRLATEYDTAATPEQIQKCMDYFRRVGAIKEGKDV